MMGREKGRRVGPVSKGASAWLSSMTALRRLWSLLVCYRRHGHQWQWFLESHKKGYEFSIECEDCGRVVFSKWLDRKSW